jgi:16S rRNA (cytosine967-C5)-methyltransferase
VKKSSSSPALGARGVAARAVAEVLGQGRALDEALEINLAGLDDRRERGLVRALAYGTLRWLPLLQAVLQPLLRKPLKAADRDLEALLLLGIFQYLESRVPDYAATSATVEEVHALGKPWAAGLINAVLRNFLRQRDDLLGRARRDPATRLAYPDWLLAALQHDWPDDWEAIAEAGNQVPPLGLRVNAQAQSRDSYLETLRAAGHQAQPALYAAQGVVLADSTDPTELPGFAAGRVSVQDPAAQQAALLLGVSPGARVLDACAAPGGKSAHILELVPDARLVAVEKSHARVTPLRETLARLHLSAEIVCADAARPDTWWDKQPFARILLDAPCSGTGVIRRHPDIKILRRPDDPPKLAARQHDLLEALWPLLASGGHLVYATCSLLAVENVQQVVAFLARHADAVEIPINAVWGRPLAVGRQILPGEEGMDGFYYACLGKL